MGTPHNPISSGIAQPTVPGSPTAPSNRVSFNYDNILPPSNLYIQRDDQLFLSVISQFGNVTFTITARLLLAGTNRIQTFQDTILIPAANPYIPSTKVLSLAEGFLLSVTVQGSLANQGPYAFFSASIVRSASGSQPNQPAYELLQNYIGGTTLLSWPGSALINSTDGPGMLRTANQGAPAAGADWVITNQTNTVWEVESFVDTFVASAAVANRQVQIEIRDGSGTPIYRGSAITSITASQTANVSGVQLAPYVSAIATDIPIPLPPRNYVPPSGTIRSITVGIQAGDQWGSPQAAVREWFAL